MRAGDTECLQPTPAEPSHRTVISIQTRQPTIGAVIEGFDARRPLNAEQLLELRGLLAQYKVVVLRNDELDREATPSSGPVPPPPLWRDDTLLVALTAPAG